MEIELTTYGKDEIIKLLHFCATQIENWQIPNQLEDAISRIPLEEREKYVFSKRFEFLQQLRIVLEANAALFGVMQENKFRTIEKWAVEKMAANVYSQVLPLKFDISGPYLDENLSALTQNNFKYKSLLKDYEKKLATVRSIINEKEFIVSEIERINRLFIKPLLVSSPGKAAEFNYSEYVSIGYESLKRGDFYLVKNILENAKRRFSEAFKRHDGIIEHEMSSDSFVNAVITNLQDGVGYLIYEQYLKEQLKRSNLNPVDRNESQYYKVFISYSLKDIRFAGRLHDELKIRGVGVFLWEEDAPAGKKLEDIMADNIRAHDKVLFIASENSIKSNACQFELSETRKKQNVQWKDVFFPIHIDEYLFQVKKRDIPLEFADEYWKNIEEIKRIHSIDFSVFNQPTIDQRKFEDAVTKLIKDLRKLGPD